jgi:transcriptional regulator with XRE-family HTH domain
MTADPRLGQRIRRLRLVRDLTLKQVGERAGVSPTHLSEIERGKTSPTVGALIRIARALGEDAARLVETDGGPGVAVTRRREGTLSLSDGASLRTFSAPVEPGDLTVAEVFLPPGLSAPRQAEFGEEFLLVLEGAVELALGERRHALREGDAIHFSASTPHGVRNAATSPARVLWVTSPPVKL